MFPLPPPIGGDSAADLHRRQRPQSAHNEKRALFGGRRRQRATNKPFGLDLAAETRRHEWGHFPKNKTRRVTLRGDAAGGLRVRARSEPSPLLWAERVCDV